MLDLKEIIRKSYMALKPVDRLVIGYLLSTLPVVIAVLTFMKKDIGVVIMGLFLRLLFVPFVCWARYYLAYNPATQVDHKWTVSFYIRQLKLCFQVPIIMTVLLDLYPIIICIYIYREDGALIANLWDRAQFLDDTLQAFEASLFGIDVTKGLGFAWREATAEYPTFNKIFGEYLHLCYFLFYIVLVGTYLFCWVLCPREHFDRFALAECSIYLFCLGFYLIAPVAGPYWQYEHPNPKDVGYLFSYITHHLVKGGSSTGTAFPSSHCGITTGVWICSMFFMPKIGYVYALICPAIVVATMWCGFHYFVDSALGVTFGLTISLIVIYISPRIRYLPPLNDAHNYRNHPSQKVTPRTRQGYDLATSRDDFDDENDFTGRADIEMSDDLLYDSAEDDNLNIKGHSEWNEFEERYISNARDL